MKLQGIFFLLLFGLFQIFSYEHTAFIMKEKDASSHQQGSKMHKMFTSYKRTIHGQTEQKRTGIFPGHHSAGLHSVPWHTIPFLKHTHRSTMGHISHPANSYCLPKTWLLDPSLCGEPTLFSPELDPGAAADSVRHSLKFTEPWEI